MPYFGTRAIALALLVLIACNTRESPRATADGAVDRPVEGGSVVIATATEPANLMPPLASTPAQLAVVDQLFDRLADPGDSLNVVGDAGFRPRLARQWRWAPDSLSIAFALDPRARWHDGRAVTGRDVRFTFDVVTDPAVASPWATLLANIDSVTAPDSLTAVFWFKRRTPQQLFDATYQLYVIPEHLLAQVPRAALARAPFAQQPVGSGRFRFAEWTRGARLTLQADADNYRGRARLDRVTWAFQPDFGAATIALIGGEADFFDALRPETLPQLARSARNVRLVSYPSLDYGFLQFNLRAPDGSGRPHRVFADRDVRRALTLAVDRERVVRSVFDSLASVAVGPVPRAIFPEWRRLRQLPYDPAQARALLDTLGWRAGADGVRAREGVPLAFSILVPSSSSVRERLATLVQEQLRATGADVTVERLDIGQFVERQRTRRFDAAMGGWHEDPNPGTIRLTWGTLGSRAPGGSNYGGYESAAFDAHVDSALDALDAKRSREHWLRAYQTAVDDAPALWLFEPRVVAGAHRRLRLSGLDADGWWRGLADWWIPAGDRIGRDRFGG